MFSWFWGCFKCSWIQNFYFTCSLAMFCNIGIYLIIEFFFSFNYLQISWICFIFVKFLFCFVLLIWNLTVSACVMFVNGCLNLIFRFKILSSSLRLLNPPPLFPPLCDEPKTNADISAGTGRSHMSDRSLLTVAQPLVGLICQTGQWIRARWKVINCCLLHRSKRSLLFLSFEKG